MNATHTARFSQDRPLSQMSWSPHAWQRAVQRGIGDDAIFAVVRWGREVMQSHGRRAFFIGKKEVEEAFYQGQDLSTYRNIAVVLSRDDALVTVIRARSVRRVKARQHVRHPRRLTKRRWG